MQAADQARRINLALSDYDYIHEWPDGTYAGDDGLIRSMAAHPAGKARPPVPTDIEPFEEKVHDVLFELAQLIIEAHRG